MNISIGQANFEGYTTEVNLQVFQKTFDDHFLMCFYTKRGIWGVTCSTFYALVYRAYGAFDDELCTTIWAPVLINRQFKQCMFTYMQYISCVGQMPQKI